MDVARYREIIQGAPLDLPLEALVGLQAIVLDLAQRAFTNAFHTDVALKRALGAKQEAFREHHPGVAVVERFFEPELDMRDLLHFILRTFLAHSEGDVALRRAVFGKLGELGRRRDIEAILPHVRTGTPSDLYHGLEAIEAITARTGTPDQRGHLADDPELVPLLTAPELEASAHRRLVEAVLARGEVVRLRPRSGENRNEVFTVTFAETEPKPEGGRRPIQGIFKPEACWPDKDRPYFTREVATYVLDRDLFGTGLVPPTVEVIFPACLDNKGPARVGSMQYLVPNARTLGTSPVRYDPRFNRLRKEESFKAAEARTRTLLYLLSDPDKFENNVISSPNLGNLLVDDQQKLWMIDNSWNLGAAPSVRSTILPEELPADLVARIQQLAANEHGVGMLETLVRPSDAQRLRQKAGTLAQKIAEHRIRVSHWVEHGRWPRGDRVGAP